MARKSKLIPTPRTKRKSYLPKDKSGKIVGGPGRPKGMPNKVTGEAKRMIALAFEGMGGLPALIEWANKNDHNRAVFYSQIYTKLIPVQVVGKLDANVSTDASGDKSMNPHFAFLERLLHGVIAQREAREPVIIDGTTNNDDTPQLVTVNKKE